MASNPPAEKPADRQEFLLQTRARIAAQAAPSPMAEEREIAGVACRLFRPQGQPRGVYMHIHGGGMVLGAAVNDDTINEARCLEHDIVVVSPDYRLAPEDPFPAGPDDCFAVARWLCEGGSRELGSDRLLLGGESAGAYMAAVTMLRIRDALDAAEKVAGLNLIFGIYDMGGTPSQRGMRPHGGFDVLDPEELDFVRDSFVPGLTNDERRHPSISPLYADLHGLPPALFTVGAADHVFDDSVFMAGRWSAFGNRTELAVYPDCPHGFPILDTELGRMGRARIESFISGIVNQPV
ncbi:MAG TPA: alpha/beta hydrolase [Candidatus Solibacter sp.]|nr:alpha/beta hydrolase [Candidatus Solibacter sp.]